VCGHLAIADAWDTVATVTPPHYSRALYWDVDLEPLCWASLPPIPTLVHIIGSVPPISVLASLPFNCFLSSIERLSANCMSDEILQHPHQHAHPSQSTHPRQHVQPYPLGLRKHPRHDEAEAQLKEAS